MKSITTFLLCTVILFACSKKEDATPSNPYDIKNVTGHYTGGSLSWQKNDNGNKTNGSDANGTFDIQYLGNNKVKVTVNTVSPVSSKTYEMPLFGKTENPGTGAGYVFQLLETSGSLQKNIALRITMTNVTSGQIDYSQTETVNSVTTGETYSINGFPGNQ